MGIAKNKVSSRGSSKPSPIYLPVATKVNCPQAGVSAILARTFLVSFPPLPPVRVITSGIFSRSFPASNFTWAVLSVRMRAFLASY
jgi:hypothetical protein